MLVLVDSCERFNLWVILFDEFLKKIARYVGIPFVRFSRDDCYSWDYGYDFKSSVVVKVIWQTLLAHVRRTPNFLTKGVRNAFYK